MVELFSGDGKLQSGSYHVINDYFFYPFFLVHVRACHQTEPHQTEPTHRTYSLHKETPAPSGQ